MDDSASLRGETILKIHKLTVDEMPSHQHGIQVSGTTLSANDNPQGGFRIQTGVGGNGGPFWSMALCRAGAGSHEAGLLRVGKNTPHSSMQPYFVCYIYKRTS